MQINSGDIVRQSRARDLYYFTEGFLCFRSLVDLLKTCRCPHTAWVGAAVEQAGF